MYSFTVKSHWWKKNGNGTQKGFYLRRTHGSQIYDLILSSESFDMHFQASQSTIGEQWVGEGVLLGAVWSSAAKEP